ncbi:RHS repeat domain-containing protein [Pontibacter chitinilyticus]|uniref:RHS repeat domain-containing protein n=1 Tax=Pontibacter chitinilyticus TaxID=2674989 RepID=UPI00321A0B8A
MGPTEAERGKPVDKRVYLKSGNTSRACFCILEHYDPWGVNLAGIEKQGNPDHKYQYNGKEKQEELGLNWMDYGARMYDAQLGRWHVADLLAEKYHVLSPFVYVANNPLKFIDSDGKEIIPIHIPKYDKDGNPVAVRGLSGRTDRAFSKLMQVNEFRDYLGMFAKKGDKIGGYTYEQNGKYSDVKFYIYDYILYAETENILTNFEGGHTAMIDETGKLFFQTLLNSYDKLDSDLIDTIVHELVLHGYADDELVKLFKAGKMKEFYALRKKLTEDVGKYDHDAKDANNPNHEGNVNYRRILRQIQHQKFLYREKPPKFGIEQIVPKESFK